jgi:UDP-3-O-acyl N-acetylglucosamine deacetylase
VRLLGYRYQRTLARTVTVSGVGFITGQAVSATFHPALPNHGLVFLRTDVPNALPIPALTHHVTDTRRRTTLGPRDASVTLVEHVLAALSGMKIDNCLVTLDGPEPPGLDGSANAFVDALADAGPKLQYHRKPIYTPTETVVVAQAGATIALHPATQPGLQLSYFLDYGLSGPIPRQVASHTLSADSFAREIAPCRTFLLEQEAVLLRQQGIGPHLTAKDVLVFASTGVVDNTLRFADEPARHKVLDMVGDLALCGMDIAGHCVAYRSGHSLNVELARALAKRAQPRATPTKRLQAA